MGVMFEEHVLLTALRGFNPWWDREPPSVPPFHRPAFYICLKYLKHSRLQRAILLSGPRRVGKTTILQQIAVHLIAQEDYPQQNILYLSLDHPLLKQADLPQLLDLYHRVIHPKGKVVLLLDEIQYSREWDAHVKQLVDHHPEYRILATGSASLVQQYQLADSGVGRWIRVPIPTLSFYEFLRIKGETLPNVPADLRPRDLFSKAKIELVDLAVRARSLLPSFHRYLLTGGFPETARLEVALAQQLLREDVIDRVLKRDMSTLFGIRNSDDLERLFVYLCLHSGGIIAVKTCATALGTSANTVSNYLAALEQTGLIYRLPPVRVGGKKVLKARYKIYIVDAGLRNAILLRNESMLSDPNELGLVVETVVLRHLFAYYYQDVPKIGYWREAGSRKEVDIVVSSPSYNIPVEVKYRDSAVLVKTDGLIRYCEQGKVTLGYFVTKQDKDFAVEACGKAEVLRIPAHIFTYLIGQAEMTSVQRQEP